ncbi:MAG: hypothetical protein M1480_07910 [Bacteroidetes bacterium]|nr:hypothetical protein [Bacteroidota bacterium]
MNVVIANDTGTFREKFVMSLLYVDQISSIGQASNYNVAINLIDKIRPEVVILDISKFIEEALKISSYVKSVNPDTIVFMLGNSSQKEFKDKCACLHADYFFDKLDEYYDMFDTLMSRIYKMNPVM